MSIIKPHIAAMTAYTPPLEGRDPSVHTLLDFNERTLPVGQMVRSALIEFIEAGRLQVYPSYGDIVEKIAKYAGVSSEQVMITNGSDQGIDLIFRSVCSAGDQAIIPSPNFAMYKQCAGVENLQVIEPEYDFESGFPVDSVIEAVTEKTKVICIPNPANPSGTDVVISDILKIAAAAPYAAILVDECYFEYAKITVANKVDAHPNIIVTRTFSKTWGLPSLRLGYVIAAEDVINGLLNVRGPYDINQLAVVAVNAALEYPDYTLDYVNEVMEQSKPLFESFLTQHSILYWPSSANYLWVFPDNPNKVEQVLLENNILVRPKMNRNGELGLRITLGSLAQTRNLIDVFDNAL